MLFVAPMCLLDCLDKSKYGKIKVFDTNKRNELKVALIYNSRYMQSETFLWLEKLIDEIIPPKVLIR